MKPIIINCFARSSLTFTRQSILKGLKIDDKDLIKTHEASSFSDVNNQITIIRKPEGCIISDSAMQKRNINFTEHSMILGMKAKARTYIDYHTTMLKHLDHILPFTFEQTTQNIDNVIRAVSNHYDIPFAASDKEITNYLRSRSEFLVSSKEANSYEYIETIARHNQEIFGQANAFYSEVLLPSVLQRQESLNLFSY